MMTATLLLLSLMIARMPKNSDIRRLYHDPKKKWGMGYYPHSRKIEIETIKTPMNRKEIGN